MTSAQPRLTYDDFAKIAPGAQQALLAMGKAVEESGLEKDLIELVKLRASQMNGCAFCFQYHLSVVKKLGVPQEKIDLLAAWRGAGIFSDREAAALSWAENVTAISQHGAPDDEAYAALQNYFSESEVVFLTVAVATINTWNRIAAALRFPPAVPQRSAKNSAA